MVLQLLAQTNLLSWSEDFEGVLLKVVSVVLAEIEVIAVPTWDSAPEDQYQPNQWAKYIQILNKADSDGP